MKVGFIGLGTMGLPMARNLLKGGFNLNVVRRANCEALGESVRIVETPAEVAFGVDVVITMLPTTEHVLSVALGPNGVSEGISPSAIFIDMSTIAPSGTQKIHEHFTALGVETMDAPVAGGKAGAEAATLTCFIGATDATLNKVRPLLKLMVSTLLHIGGNGAGTKAKLVHNICNATLVSAFSEAIVFGTKLGINPKILVDVLSLGSCANVLKNNVYNIGLKRKFNERTFPAEYMIKDILLAKESATELNIPLFFPSLSLEFLTMLKAKGLGRNTYAEVITIFEEFAGIQAGIDEKSN